jgi:hypothetical protein
MPTPNPPPFYREDRAPADLANRTSELTAHRLDAPPLEATRKAVNINLQRIRHKTFRRPNASAALLRKGLFTDLRYGHSSAESICA